MFTSEQFLLNLHIKLVTVAIKYSVKQKGGEFIVGRLFYVNC